MCHYYANPLSVLLSDELDDKSVSMETLELVRTLPSFRAYIESTLKEGDIKQVRDLLDDDKQLILRITKQKSQSKQWALEVLRNVELLAAVQTTEHDFVQNYLDAMSVGIDLEDEHKDFTETIQRMSPTDAAAFIVRVVDIIKNGDSSIGLPGQADENQELITTFSDIQAEIEILQEKSEEEGTTLKSKYSGHNKILRTTVIAQKVQLSRDTANLTDEDKAYTTLIDRIVENLTSILHTAKAEDIFLHELWLYDLRTPYKDVFVPRPRTVMERALSRPHDYLGCSCCRSGQDEIKPTLPVTAILYHLYLETGNLINVADLWSAFYAIVGEDKKDGLDERTALVLFYRAMSELKTMGFVKQSRKKADHIAKLAWQGL